MATRKRWPTAGSSCGALTLVEMMVVMWIIVLLAGLLLWAITNARRQAALTSCLNNLHQISLSMENYNIPNQYLPVDGFEDAGINYGEQPTNLLWGIQPQPIKRGLGLMIPSYANEPAVFFQRDAIGTPFIGDNGWLAADGSANFQSPAASVMSSYLYRENFANPVGRRNKGATATVTEFNELGAGYLAHRGDGVHILFADGHVFWYDCKFSPDDLDRFDFLSLTALDPVTGKSGWEMTLDTLGGP